MLSNLRILAWRVVDRGRQALLQHRSGYGGGEAVQNIGAGTQQNLPLYRYLQQQQVLKKQSNPFGGGSYGRGGGSSNIGPSSGRSGPLVASNGPLVGLLGRLGPLVSGAVRRLTIASARRGGNRRAALYRDSAPLFAFVGVSLLGFEDGEESSGAAPSRKQQGFVTRQEELEAICGTIRNAVRKSGWLQDSVDYTETGAPISPDHVYSTQDLDFAGVIDKGCNAVVYAARWRNTDPPEQKRYTDDIDANQTQTDIKQPENGANHAENGDNITENGANQAETWVNQAEAGINHVKTGIASLANNSQNLFSSQSPLHETTSSLINLYNIGGLSASTNNLDNDSRRTSLIDLYGGRSCNNLNLAGARNNLSSSAAFDSDSCLRSLSMRGVHRERSLSSSYAMGGRLPSTAEDAIDSNYNGGATPGPVAGNQPSPLSVEVSRLVSNGMFKAATPLHRTVRFASGTSFRSSGDRNTPVRSAVAGKRRLPPTSQYPLAVKLLFNYEAASNAPAIVSALYKELVPARRLQLDETYEAWRDDFFGDSSHPSLPHHPCIVEMSCAFVDRVPLLPGGLQLYPTALPPRLSDQGLGRNMSLFCVMRRYDMSLGRYLEDAAPLAPRTQLLLLTQLLEAVQHLHRNNVAHRDLKPDNILISVSDSADWTSPQLVVTDLGCCLPAESPEGLHVPFVTREAEPRQGNSALMAPEVKTAKPGPRNSVDFTSCDLWAAGTIAYQIYGLPNPFLDSGADGAPMLDSRNYRESQLSGLTPAPPVIRRLVADILKRRPRQRPSPTVAATVCQLSLWAPGAWLNRRSISRPSHDQVMEWLLCLTAKVLCERRGSRQQSSNISSIDVEYRLVSTLLARVRYNDVRDAISWNRAF